MLKFTCRLASFLAVLAVTQPAEAAKGVVVYVTSGCSSRYVLQTAGGYALLEWYGGSSPSAGDIVVGAFEEYGLKDLYNVTQDSDTKAYVDDYLLGRSSLVEKLKDKCG